MWSDNIFVSTSNGMPVVVVVVARILFTLKFSYNKIYTGLLLNRNAIPIQLSRFSCVRSPSLTLSLSCTVCVCVSVFHTDFEPRPIQRHHVLWHPCHFVYVRMLSLSLNFHSVHGAPLLLTVSLASSLALFFYGSCVVRTYAEKHAHTHMYRLHRPKSHGLALCLPLSRSLILILVCTNFGCFWLWDCS